MGKDANGNEWSETNIPIPSIGGDVLRLQIQMQLIVILGLIQMTVVVVLYDIDSFISNEACDSYDWNDLTLRVVHILLKQQIH